MNSYTDKTAENRTKQLVAQMTLEEKVSQLVNDAAEIKRLNIKKYEWWNEALHGVARAGTATVFPQAIGLAASFNTSLLFDVATAISDEARAKYNEAQKEKNYERYYGLTFWSPNINIFRDPRWGRGQETYGEDPFLTSRLAESFISGMQGDTEHLKTAACVKHFAVHSGPEMGRFSFDSVVGKMDLNETYLSAFEYSVKNVHPETVMASYNKVNGVPACCNSELLTETLRKKWGFDGHVVSDCGAVHEIFKSHHYADSDAEAAALAIKAGCDLNCGTAYEKLIDAYEQDLITEDDIDRALVRVMRTRVKLGMFDEKTEYDHLGYDDVCCEKHKKLCEQMTRESLVLLKNNGILPLDENKVSSILLVGANGDDNTVLLGNYNGFPSEYHNLRRGLCDRFGADKIKYEKGCALLSGTDEEIEKAASLAAKSDVTVLCLGLNSQIEGEQGDADDRKTIELPECQQKLLERICESTDKVILVLMTGSAAAVPYAEEHCDAIINAWYPGEFGGKSVAELIAGDFSPSGCLPVTYYASSDDLPDISNYSMKNRTYRYFNGKPLFPFGFGLHYTTFEFSSLECDGKTATVKVKNTGKMHSKTAVQIYADSASVEGSPALRLIGFAKTELDPGQTATVTAKLDEKAFVLFDENGETYTPEGEFTVYAGNCLPTARSFELGADKFLSTKLV